MTETITKENDYSLKIENIETNIYGHDKITRSFNFASGQITTLFVSQRFHHGGYKSGGAGAATSNMHIQNFTDLSSTIELEILHKKLEELDGHPPPLGDVLNGRHKRPLSVTPHKIG